MKWQWQLLEVVKSLRRETCSKEMREKRKQYESNLVCGTEMESGRAAVGREPEQARESRAQCAVAEDVHRPEVCAHLAGLTNCIVTSG